jgi:hypothetical protein
MSSGLHEAWTARFKTLDEKLLERIRALYPACITALGSTADEDAITLNLVTKLLGDPEVRELFHYIEFQFQPTAIQNGVHVSLGIIDMAAFRDQNRDLYLAYECKRLNVIWQNKRHSLAGNYVKDGLVRFSQQQYCRDLPVGWMLGYVMDRDVAHARTCTHRAIKRYANLVSLVEGPKPEGAAAGISRFSTLHQVGVEHIRVQHALM